MVTISGNNIYMTRGDTATLDLTITNEDGSIYTPGDTDVILFTVKKSTADCDVVLQKRALDGKITIKATETASLPYGTYYYDVELSRADGFVCTVITPKTLKLCEEVTF